MIKLVRNFFYKIKFQLYLRDHLTVMRNREIIKNKLAIIKSEIAELNYDFKNYFIENIFNNLPINFPIFFGQYNMYRHIYPTKINKILLKKKKIIYPLRDEQIKILKKYNYEINTFLSKFLIFLACFVELFRGISFFLIFLGKSILNLISFRKFDKKYIYIKDMNQGQLNSINSFNRNFKFWIEKKLNLNDYNLVHNNPVCKKKFIYNKLLIPELYSLKEILKFLFLFFKFNIFVFLDIIFLRFSHLLIYSEIIKLASSLAIKKEDLKNLHFFFNTNPFFRPLYTYGLGKNVYYFDISINDQPIYYEKKELPYNANVKKLTWENYIIWNDDHKKVIQDNQIINANYKILGPISFGPSKHFFSDMKSDNSILVFDSIAFRRSFLSSHNYYGCTYIDYNILKFLKDINNLSQNNFIYLKTKRNMDKKIYSKKYKKFITKSNFKLLDHRYDPEEVILKFKKVICLPFSSTAYIAKKFNKKVCFYDVCGIHKDFDNYYKDIPIIRSFSELQKWSQD